MQANMKILGTAGDTLIGCQGEPAVVVFVDKDTGWGDHCAHLLSTMKVADNHFDGSCMALLGCVQEAGNLTDCKGNVGTCVSL